MPIQYALILSTLCQRLGLGTYIIGFLAVKWLGAPDNLSLLARIALPVFALGVLFSTAHLGRPARLLNSFSNPKSRLTQEGFVAPLAGGCLLLLALDGAVIHLSAGMLLAVQVAAMVASVAFVWVTGLVYQLFARPAWKTRLVGVNFLLSTAALGSVGEYCWAMATGASARMPLDRLLYACIVTSLLMNIGQIAYSIKASRLAYGVAVRPLSAEFKSVFLAWVLTGVLLPQATMLSATVFGQTGILAALLLASSLAGLAFWRSYFFMAGKEIKFFPQYRTNLSTNY